MSSLPKSLTKRNTSGLHPKGRAVLVEPVETELVSSIIKIPDTARERAMMVEVNAIVVEVGPEAWKEEKVPRAKVGEKVLISKWCGHITTGKDGNLYRLVNAEDIFCGVD